MGTDPHGIHRKPLPSTTSLSQVTAENLSQSANVPSLEDTEGQTTRPKVFVGYSQHPVDQGARLLHSDRSPRGATTDHEKSKRPKDKYSKPHDRARYWTRLSYRTWLWECLSCVAVAGLSCAIIVVLAVYNGKPLPQLPFSISLNVMVSLLATALKAALIIPTAACISQLKWSWYRRTHSLSDIATYDEASRGPYGAVLLLCSSRLRGLASLGALLTILAVAIDPFTQQVIRYRPCASAYANSTAAVVRAQNYSVSGDQLSTGSQGYRVGMDLDMQAAIYQGAYGLPSNGVSLLARCETGNCSFPHHAGVAYQSLGVCHKCADVSSSIITFCQNGTFNDCNYTLPLQPNITSQYARKSNETSIWWPATSMNDSSQLGPSMLESQYWQGAVVLEMLAEYTREQLLAQTSLEGDMLANPGIALVDTNSVGKFAYISFSYYWNETDGGDGAPIYNYPIAVECGLYPCIQSYSASVEKGLLVEKVVHQQYLHWPNLPAVDLDAAASPCVVDGKDVDASDIQVSWNITSDALGVDGGTPKITGVTPANQQCLYHLDMSSLSAMINFFVKIFVGDVYYAQVLPSDPWLSMLWKGGANNLTTTNTTMANIAKSMTNNMRIRASNSEPVLGQVWASETCVQVQWAWLTLHALLVVLCVLFLALTILMSSKSTTGQLWKSSTLALMYHGLDAAIMEKVGMIDAVDEMEERARHLRVHAAYTDQGWRFVESLG